MSSKVVRDKVAAYLDTNWVATPIAGDENEIDEPPETLDPWLSYGFQGASEEVQSIGSPDSMCYRESGSLYVNVWVASGTGSSVALGYAEDVRSMLRQLNLGDGVKLGVAHPPDVGIPSQTDSSVGNFFAYAVVIAYDYDYQA